MPLLCKPAVSVPEHAVSQDETLEVMRRLHAGHPQLRSLLRMVRHTGVKVRYLVRPLERSLSDVSFGQRQSVFDTEARKRLPQVVAEALRNADIASGEIDAIVFVSCTSVAMPSPTAWMINELGFAPHTAQIPLMQLGCAAGAAAINRACDFARAQQGHVLIVSCEFCSLLYQPEDRDVGSLLSSALFGDAVAAAVVRADDQGPGLCVKAQGSYVLPDTVNWISYEVTDRGLHFRLDKGVPQAMARMLAPLTAFVEQQGHSLSDIDRFAFHTGGPRVLEALRSGIGVTDHALAPSFEALHAHGNIGSAAILQVLTRTFTALPPQGATMVAAGFGPGITMEMLFGTWTHGNRAVAG
ncbi:type III polyketide synthase [Streptomyces sp. NPDC059569]|uniref:type III polyketide synthase n=1 Tax=Streptomyces sp. NPDC059569 TaxID=3346869 RepID=UPI00369FB378